MTASNSQLILKSKWTWIALLLVCLSVLALGSRFSGAAGWWLMPAIALLGLVSVAIWWLLYPRSAEYQKARVQADIDMRHAKAAALQASLEEVGLTTAASHVGQLTDKLDAFINVLKLRFSEGEVTYHRYLGVGTQVYDGAFRNLESLQAQGRSIAAIDPRRIQEQITELNYSGRGDSREAVALKERLALFETQAEQVDRLIAQNEEALTALSDTTTALANVDTAAGEKPEMESIIDHLRELAQRVDSYGVRI